MPTVPPESFMFCGPSFLAASPVIDAQRSINLYPETEYKSSKTGMALIGRPGLSPSPFITLANSPARALWAGHLRLFAVGGTHFYELSAAGGVITDYGAMAGSGGTGPCQIIANGTQLLVMDLSADSVYNAAGGVMTKVFNAVALEYLDGFYVAIAIGASLAGVNPNQINVSAFQDGTTWGALNFVLRTDAADLTNQLAVLNGLLWIFGEKTISVYYNAGNPGFPFARVQGASINLGCLSPQSVVKFYNTIMWLGADANGYAQVYMSQGTNPVKVSNAAIENYIDTVNRAIIASSGASAYGTASAYGYEENGHTFYVLNFGQLNPGSIYFTIVYDLTTGLWHERTYAAAQPICFASLPGWATTATYANFVGDFRSGKIYDQSITYPNDGTGNSITYTRTAPHVSNTNKWVRHSRFELDGSFGTAQPTLDYSDDGGVTFGGRTRALQQAVDQGRGTVSPTFRRFFANQLGRSRDRVYKVTCTDGTNLIRIANAYIDVDL